MRSVFERNRKKGTGNWAGDALEFTTNSIWKGHDHHFIGKCWGHQLANLVSGETQKTSDGAQNSILSARHLWAILFTPSVMRDFKEHDASSWHHSSQSGGDPVESPYLSMSCNMKPIKNETEHRPGFEIWTKTAFLFSEVSFRWQRLNDLLSSEYVGHSNNRKSRHTDFLPFDNHLGEKILWKTSQNPDPCLAISSKCMFFGFRINPDNHLSIRERKRR
jgi:hypothetical protein